MPNRGLYSQYSHHGLSLQRITIYVLVSSRLRRCLCTTEETTRSVCICPTHQRRRPVVHNWRSGSSKQLAWWVSHTVGLACHKIMCYMVIATGNALSTVTNDKRCPAWFDFRCNKTGIVLLCWRIISNSAPTVFENL